MCSDRELLHKEIEVYTRYGLKSPELETTEMGGCDNRLVQVTMSR